MKIKGASHAGAIAPAAKPMQLVGLKLAARAFWSCSRADLPLFLVIGLDLVNTCKLGNGFHRLLDVVAEFTALLWRGL